MSTERPARPSQPRPNPGRPTIAFIGNHTPRQCGIATFTADLSGALRTLHPELGCTVVAMNDRGRQYAYPAQVRFQIAEANPSQYHAGADELNVAQIGLVSVQHEYGIFGGQAGAHLLMLLRPLRMPIVTTLHTVLSEPTPEQRGVMDELCALSARVVVMSETAKQLLHRVHGVPLDKIDMIPHGIPTLPPFSSSRERLGLQDQQVLLTFGLLSPDKGIEQVIDALPAIIERHANAVYIVLGATHPHVKAEQGEAYRLMLQARARRLKVETHVAFHDRFASTTELCLFLAAADIYITPYLNEDQITSGTLAYAVGAGKAVVSSQYLYASELLADERGVLVPIADSGAMAEAVSHLLGDPVGRARMERRAAQYGEQMAWPEVARAYLQTFHRAVIETTPRPAPRVRQRPVVRPLSALPEVDLSHLQTMTDDTGILQHAIWTVPRYQDGYCVDDNARALLLISLAEEAQTAPIALTQRLGTRYLAFVAHALDEANGRFRNFMSYGRVWTEARGSEDSHGRTIWSLGTTVACCPDPGRRGLARQLFECSVSTTLRFTSPRAWSYAILGIDALLRAEPRNLQAIAAERRLAENLLTLFRMQTHPGWRWFEDTLTYANARLCQALLAAGLRLNDDEMVSSALVSLDWLADRQDDAGLFAPVGSNGFFPKGGPMAAFDQQPIEACGMVSACLLAFRATADPKWSSRAQQAFDWFLGKNHLEVWLYDPRTGGCRDGLHEDRANENQGAESTLSFLQALFEVRQAAVQAALQTSPAVPANGGRSPGPFVTHETRTDSPC